MPLVWQYCWHILQSPLDLGSQAGLAAAGSRHWHGCLHQRSVLVDSRTAQVRKNNHLSMPADGGILFALSTETSGLWSVHISKLIPYR